MLIGVCGGGEGGGGLIALIGCLRAFEGGAVWHHWRGGEI